MGMGRLCVTTARSKSTDHLQRGAEQQQRWSYLRVSASLLGSVEHLQSRLGHGLGLVQERHLLLVVLELGGHAHRGIDQRVEVTGQLGHLLKRVGTFRCGSKGVCVVL